MNYLKSLGYSDESIKKIKQYRFDHRIRNREKILEYRKNWQKKKIACDPSYKIAGNLRHRLWQFFKKAKKPGSHLRDLGCTISELKSFIESKFQSGMTWDNYGAKGWHLDHVKPLSSFNLSNPEELKKACHYTNLQPLWWFDNMRKSNK
jgi:hypothetical protein